ncbi:hypothetical protein [uncultured Arthrobacter sp.]|uniref:hypothetical protein n=1 Tax=uncultured Arthrobacter sp. TaxID=114050 RepID=UPI0028D497CE|nr:hypothetical protein [uncultured Arthrobacter sp.]
MDRTQESVFPGVVGQGRQMLAKSSGSEEGAIVALIFLAKRSISEVLQDVPLLEDADQLPNLPAGLVGVAREKS